MNSWPNDDYKVFTVIRDMKGLDILNILSVNYSCKQINLVIQQLYFL